MTPSSDDLPFTEDDESICTQVGAWLWFSDSRKDKKQAKAFCEACQAAGKCRDWAVEQVDLDGVWGATTKSDRQAIRRQRASNSGDRRTNDSSDSDH